jgi:hypothetical protein
MAQYPQVRGQPAPFEGRTRRRHRGIRGGQEGRSHRDGNRGAHGPCGLHHGQYRRNDPGCRPLLGDRGEAGGLPEPCHAQRRLERGIGQQHENRGDRVAKTGADVPRVYGGPAGWISVLIPAAIFAWFLQFLGPVAAGEQVLLGIDWVPSMDIRLSILIDGLSLTFGSADLGDRGAGDALFDEIPRQPPRIPAFRPVPDALHGGDAGPCPVRQPHRALRVLGNHDDFLLPADRVRQRQREVAALGAAGALADGTGGSRFWRV